MIEWPIAVFLLSLVVIQEVWGSGVGFSAAMKSFWLHSQKNKTPSRVWTALIFISLTMIWFAVWESLLRFMLQALNGWPLSLLGSVLLLSVLFKRSLVVRKDVSSAWSMTRVDWTLSLVGFAFLIQAWLSALLMGAWVYWRATKVLPLRLPKN